MYIGGGVQNIFWSKLFTWTLYTDSCVSNYVLESLFVSSRFLKRPYNNSKIKEAFNILPSE